MTVPITSPEPSMRRLTLLAAMTALISVAAPALGDATPPAGPDAFAAQSQAIAKSVRDYIVNNPRHGDEALQLLQTAVMSGMLDVHKAALYQDPASPVLGNPNGKITLIEFFDYRCPYCKVVAPALRDLISRNPDLRVVMKEFPILSPESRFAAQVALVAARHGRYAEFHRAMFALDGKPDRAAILATAQAQGLDPGMVAREAQAPEIAAEIDGNLQLAHEIGVDATPSFIGGDQIAPGATDVQGLEGLIAAAKAKG
jgi:protein-disulfide isomerase